VEAQAGKADSEPTPARVARMKRTPGGRHRVVRVVLTDEEREVLGTRASAGGVSVQRYLVEAGLSGSAGAATEAREARRDVERIQLGLAGIANNVNQLAKWANTNHALPDTFEAVLGDIRRASGAVVATSERLNTVFGMPR
jgi:hypothetical protein